MERWRTERRVKWWKQACHRRLQPAVSNVRWDGWESDPAPQWARPRHDTRVPHPASSLAETWYHPPTRTWRQSCPGQKLWPGCPKEGTRAAIWVEVWGHPQTPAWFSSLCGQLENINTKHWRSRCQFSSIRTANKKSFLKWCHGWIFAKLILYILKPNLFYQSNRQKFLR